MIGNMVLGAIGNTLKGQGDAMQKFVATNKWQNPMAGSPSQPGAQGGSNVQAPQQSQQSGNMADLIASLGKLRSQEQNLMQAPQSPSQPTMWGGSNENLGLSLGNYMSQQQQDPYNMRGLGQFNFGD